MAHICKSQLLSSDSDEALIIERLLAKIEKKLQALVTNIGRQNIQSKDNSEILTRDDYAILHNDSQQINVSLKEKCTHILYQMEVLQMLLAEKSLQPLLTDSKAYDFCVKKSFQSATSKKHLQSYIETSFAAKDKDKSDALKEIILSLCNESELQLKSRIFLKGEIQDHFSKANITDHISVEESKNQTEHYLENFISQIGQLRQKIQTLEEQNLTLIKQNTQIAHKLQSTKNPTSFQNPEHIHDKKFTNKHEIRGDCQSCFKLSEDNKFMAFKAKKLDEVLMRKEKNIKEINEEFSREVLKYNKVFKNLSEENESLKKYINQDLGSFIKSLETQIFHLKSTERYRKFETQERRKFQGFMHHQNEYYYKNPKISTQIFRTPSHQNLNANVFSNCSIQDYLPVRRSRILIKMPERSKSKHSKQSLQSRPHSFKSHSPNLAMKKFAGPRISNPDYVPPNWKEYERD